MSALAWRDWPLSERTGGPPASPMDETFFEKWRDRDLAQRTRPATPGVLINQDLNAPFATAWTDAGPAGKIYVPPWANSLEADYWVGFVATAGSAGKIWVRLKIGNAVEFPLLELINFFAYSGVAGTKVATSSIWNATLDDHRDTVQTAQWQYRVEQTSGSLVDLDIRYFALGGQRLPWRWIR